MSVENAKKFLDAANLDKKIQDKMIEAMKARQNDQIAIGKEAGYQFTEDEYKNAILEKYGDKLTVNQKERFKSGDIYCCCCAPCCCCA